MGLGSSRPYELVPNPLGWEMVPNPLLKLLHSAAWDASKRYQRRSEARSHPQVGIFRLSLAGGRAAAAGCQPHADGGTKVSLIHLTRIPDLAQIT